MKKKNLKKAVKIGIDIDNVISDSYPAYLDKFNIQYKTDIKIHQISEFYYLNKIIEENKNIPGRKIVNFIDELVLDEEFQLNLPPIDDSVRVINNWVSKGYKIHYVTARPVEVREITIKWLEKHGYWVKGAELDLFNSRKGFSSDAEYKADIAVKYKICVFIEDALEIALKMPIPVLLFDRPWNKFKAKKNLIRISSWKEIEDTLPKVLK
ncbi:hypothetical protein A3B48_01790 [Candidatus Gottesmanbacteria bacterium RIFCSPLOWO2_01_FULL_40_10]|nr:MAG: hypothetical protein A3B48_01790 [Candidatus Gottesmanbacteria bacterium RIFCSPLOWO2_01_FULL_40_10]OGG32747.1 MAG: hypothetical protein A3I80_00290 [Candidatus Gottesmanbacteria bacterium RIFCSPLOWO2_02_FULL_40_10]